VDPISRRNLFGTGVGAALGLSNFAAPASARDVDPELVAHWMTLMGLLRRHDAMFGPHDVLDTARRELGVIAEHRQVARGELRAQLLRVESRWSWFASWLGRDVGDAHVARQSADRALHLAREAEYPDMVAYVFMRLSLWASDARRAIALAQAGSGTPDTSSEIRALCALRLAHGHALAGDVGACERSLADAHRLLDRADTRKPWDDPGGHDTTRPYVLAEEARCWLVLRPHKAAGMFEDVVRLWPRDRTRGRGIHQAHLALACAAAGEPDRAAVEGVKAVDIARTTRSDVTVRELELLDRRLADSDAPAVADFREAFAAV
jgi:hypothetical protein